MSVHLVNERASCAADWRLFCPDSWDDAALDDPVAAAAARRRRERAGIPGEVRHVEKWRLALEMIDEMAGPGGWGVLDQVTGAGGARPVVVADAGYGDNALFRGGLTGPRLAVRGGGQGHRRRPPARRRARGDGLRGQGRPSVPRYRTPPLSLRQLAIAHAGQIQRGTWRQGTGPPRQP